MAKCDTLAPCAPLLLIAAAVLLLATSTVSASAINDQPTSDDFMTMKPLIGGRRVLQQVG
jgi:hypothetical protein